MPLYSEGASPPPLPPHATCTGDRWHHADVPLSEAAGGPGPAAGGFGGVTGSDYGGTGERGRSLL